MLKLKQYFCRHDFKVVGIHRNINSRLSRCSKCGVYEHLHMGIMCSFKTNDINPDEWKFN